MGFKDLPRHAAGCIALSIGLVGCNDAAHRPTVDLEVAAVGVQAGAIADDGDFALVGSLHRGASLWRLSDTERLFDWNHRKDESTIITAADFSPDGKWALTTDSQTLVLWKADSGEAHRFWHAPDNVLALVLSADGRHALLGLGNHTAVLFDVQRGGIKRTLHHQGRVTSVALSGDGRFALTGSEDRQARWWDLETGQVLQQVSHDESVQLVALSPTNNLAFSAASYDRAVLWDTGNGQIIGALPLAAQKLQRGLRFTAARFNADGSLLLTGLPDRIVELWDSRSLTRLQRWLLPKRDAWKPSSSAVVALGFNEEQDGRFVALASSGFIHHLDRQVAPADQVK